ncbi:MAG: hypothetical protein JSS81_02410 [Acidobacteria bacterium]|nr:hypothetical protein [Acidobacteriota bacterium]
MNTLDSLIPELPDPEAARRFLDRLGELNPAQLNRLLKNEGLLSDVLAIVSDSPLLATTLLQNPGYFAWLNRRRADSKIRDKEELLEALARFSLMNSTVEPQVLLARFRRRELLRIFLHDLRGLTNIAEITEEISNLADAILEYALRLARQELDNRFGPPLETDPKGRAKTAGFCVVSLGKLGSKELNYASDIDLLFLYSADGKTSGRGAKGEVTNREYFVKLAEFVTKLVGRQTGEGAAYRVDLRLRPHGRIGALALSVKDTVRYYRTEARGWERQVMIRARASAGDAGLFREFYREIEDFVFSRDQSVEAALENVRHSKEQINLEKASDRGFDVKLGRGGIREIEFIAQALQLAHGGRDEWLRSSHTLITLTRLADRRLLTEKELTELFAAYDFLRRLEHLLQMENGLQTHLVPDDPARRALFGRRMNFAEPAGFEAALDCHTGNVHRVYRRVLAVRNPERPKSPGRPAELSETVADFYETEDETTDSVFSAIAPDHAVKPILASLEKSDLNIVLDGETLAKLERLAVVSPPFAALVAANPALIAELPDVANAIVEKDYAALLLAAVRAENDFAHRLAALRRKWAACLLELVVYDVFEKIDRKLVKKLQTRLAEASLEAALLITRDELENRFSAKIDDFRFAVLGLGKLGGRGMDYGSDLDLVLVYEDDLQKERTGEGEKRRRGEEEKRRGEDKTVDGSGETESSSSESVSSSPPLLLSSSRFQSRAVELFVTTLSAMTREGSLYRVDLRLRPDGKNGAASSGRRAFLDYLANRAAVWEWLAYIKLRAVGGDSGLGEDVEREARRIVHERARQADRAELKSEARRIRERLEEQKTASRRHREIDIKFGAGGMLDVYFAMRYLQLRDDVPDDPESRSTDAMLERLYENGSLGRGEFDAFTNGYLFLTELDHHLRLTVGRSTRLPVANQPALRLIAGRMKLESVAELLERLTFHRLEIRAAFDSVLG